MKISDRRLISLITILNENIGQKKTVAEWVKLIDEKFPSSELKPTQGYSTHNCDPASHKQTIGVYLGLLEVMGYTARYVHRKPDQLKKNHYFRALIKVPLNSRFQNEK